MSDQTTPIFVPKPKFTSPLATLSRDDVERIISRADDGQEDEWFTLCLEALSRDDVLMAAAKARADAALHEVTWRGGDDFEREVIERAAPSSLLFFLALHAPAFGFALAEYGFKQTPAGPVLQHLFPVHSRMVTFARDTDDPLLAFDDGSRALQPNKFLLVTAHGVGLAIKRGYLRRAIFPTIERLKLTAKMSADVMKGRSIDKADEGRAAELRRETCAIVLDEQDRQFDGQLLLGALRRIVAAARAASQGAQQSAAEGA